MSSLTSARTRSSALLVLLKKNITSHRPLDARRNRVPYKTEVLEYGTTMKGSDYLAINSMGKVPAIRHGDTIVTECAAICAYLADAFSDASLAPPVEDRGAYYRWLFFAAGPMEAAVSNRALGFEAPEGKET